MRPHNEAGGRKHGRTAGGHAGGRSASGLYGRSERSPVREFAGDYTAAPQKLRTDDGDGLSGGTPDNGGRTAAEWLRSGIVCALLLVLFREWLAPLVALSDVTEIYDEKPFVAAFALLLLLDWVGLRGPFSLTLKAVVCVGFAGYLHAPGQFPGAAWWGELGASAVSDAVLLLQGDPAAMSPQTRTILFMAGWAFLLAVVHSLVLQRQHGVWFVALTAAYLLVLPLVYSIDTAGGMLRTLGAGLLMQALLQLPRLELYCGVRRLGLPAGWLAACAAAALGCVLIGALGSQLADRDAGPANWGRFGEAALRWLQPYAGTTASSYSRTGYGDDDAELGGPLRQSDDVAFVARTPRLTYWRGEAKSVYTGKGWLQPASRLEQLPGVPAAASAAAPSPGGDAAAHSESGSAAGRQPSAASREAESAASDADAGGQSEPVQRSDSSASGAADRAAAESPLQAPAAVSGEAGAETSASTPAGRDEQSPARAAADSASGVLVQEIVPKQPMLGKQLFAAGVIVQADELFDKAGQPVAPQQVWGDTASGRTTVPRLDGALSYYKVRSVPFGAEGPEGAQPPLPDSLRQLYLQLPDTLPARVRTLAGTIAASSGDSYAKAQAIETYLRDHYAYTMSDVQPSSGNEDFVDRFLFELKRGYCDYFSTSMAVMLRSVGIPSRWVKGFAPGTVVSAGQADTPTWASASASAEPNAGRGERVSAREESPLIVEVRNRDAHSWVEAYIDGVGWVSFDPTPGNGAAAAPAGEDRETAVQKAASTGSSDSGLRLLAGQAAAKLQSAAELSRSVVAASWRKPLPLALAGAAVAAGIAAAVWRLYGRFVRAGSNDSRRQLVSTPAVRQLRRIVRRWTKKHGLRESAQTVREYVLSRQFADERERLAAVEFVKLVEAASYDPEAANRMTKRQVTDVWRKMNAGG